MSRIIFAPGYFFLDNDENIVYNKDSYTKSYLKDFFSPFRKTPGASALILRDLV